MKPTEIRWYRGICLVIVAIAIIFLPANPVRGQEKQEKKELSGKAASAKASDKAGKNKKGEDPNIKNKSNQNDPSKTLTEPIKKGGATRGYGSYTCIVHVDNRTAWDINVFVDGSFRGAVGGAGDLYIATGNGATTLYAEADFTDGSYIPWGPRSIDCESTYTWTLYP